MSRPRTEVPLPALPMPRWVALPALLFVLLTSGFLQAQDRYQGKTIERILIEPADELTRLDTNSLLSQLRIRSGSPYDRAEVSREAARLYSLGQFSRVEGPFVSPFQDGVSIRFRVAARPTIVDLQFFGNQAKDDGDLIDGTPPLRTQSGALYNKYISRQDAETIREQYLEDGYLFVQVEARAERVRNGVLVTFRIVEGPQVSISEVRFRGNRAFSSSELAALMATKERDTFFFGLWDSGYYNHADLQADVITLKRFYQSSGFLDVEIEPLDLELDKSKETLVLQVLIDEGEQYTFRGYRFEGNKVFASRTLRDLTTAPVGKPFSAERLEQDRRAILDYYKDRAYIFADAREEYINSFESNDVWVVLNIDEQNEVFIDKIKVKGNINTKDTVVRRELEIYPGERVDKSALDKSRSNLARLGIFTDIRYSYEDSDLPSNKNLVVNVDESTFGQFIIGFGITSGFGLIGNIQYSKRNFDMLDWPETLYDLGGAFTGAGQTVNIVAKPGTRYSTYRLNFVEPYLFGTRNQLSITGESLDILREDWEEGRARFRTQISHAFDFDRDLTISLGIRFEEVEIEDLEPDAPPDAFASEGKTSLVAADIGMRYDKRLIEPFEGPFDGHRESVFYKFAGDVLGGHVDYHSVEVSQDLYFPLYTHRDGNYHHVIALKNRFGWARPFDSGDTIPIFERFYLGGPQDVRGFRFRGLGPHQNNEPVGGTQQLWGNLEYSFPIYQKLLRGVVWFDYGNLAPVASFDLRETRFATGAGIRINFPFLGRPLPIGLYFGSPLHKEPDDESRFFLFTIGDSF